MQLQLRYASDGDQWYESDDVTAAEFRGLVIADVSRLHGERRFTVVRDPGSFQCVGTFDGANGGGTWTFEPSAAFANDLARRGVGAPSEREQFELAMSDFHLATLDELLSSGFEKPSPEALVEMNDHGVNEAFIRAMKDVPLNPKTVGELSRLRDHGVDSKFAAVMMKYDPSLSGEDLATCRDHGVSVDYVQGLERLGYHPGAGDLVRLSDHGVTIAFIERLAQHGYAHLSADDLIRLRDSGF